MTISRSASLAVALIGAALVFAHCSLAQVQSATAPPATEVASSCPSVRCTFGTFGKGTSVLVMGNGSAGTSRGLSLELDAGPDDRLVLSTNCTVKSGNWTLRIDDGTNAPNYLPLGALSRVLVAGSSRYRVLVYSDDADAMLEFRGLSLDPAQPQDLGLPLAWPTAGPILDAERAKVRAAWLDLLSIRDPAPDVAKAKAIARFVYQRSSVVGIDAPRFAGWGSPAAWRQDVNRRIDGDCGVFANAMGEMCGVLGIVNRIVCLGSAKFYGGESLGDTHALVEVFDPESKRWVLIDPTFNVEFVRGDGSTMGIAALFEAQRAKADWRAIPLGPQRRGRTIEAYYLPFAELLYCGDAPAVLPLGEQGAAFRSQQETVLEVARRRYKPVNDSK